MRYSSSTTRRQRPSNSLDSSMWNLRRNRDQDVAPDAVRAELEPRFRIELVRKRTLYQFAAVTLSFRRMIYRNPALPPFQRNHWKMHFLLQLPAHIKPAARLGQCSVFYSIGSELMKS